MVEGREKECVCEREEGRERIGYEPLREAQPVVAAEGGACSLPGVGVAVFDVIFVMLGFIQAHDRSYLCMVEYDINKVPD